MRKIYNFLSSVKLAVAIFFLLASGSIAGTLIEQGLSPEEYITRYGEKWYGWIQAIRLTDVYHSWWFSGLLVLLAVNLAVCLSKRVPAIWRAYSSVDCDFTHNLVLNFKHHTIVPFPGNIEDAKGKVESSLKRRKYKLWRENNHGKIAIFATKGAIGRLGPVISHVSIFLILIGAALSSAIGFRGFLPIFEGVPVNVPEGNFNIVLDKFWIDYYENGMIKDYFSSLSIIDNGKMVLSKTIQVNDPMQYKGIWFYQSSYGTAWDRADKVFIRITDKKSGTVINDATLDFRKEKEVAGTDLRLNVSNFIGHFAFDPQTKQVFARSAEHENPAVQIDIYEGGKLISSPWIFYKYPNIFPIEGSKYNFILSGYTAPQYSGIQIAKDPGVNIVWVGSGLLMVGLFISFFIFHRRLWIKIEPSENNTMIYIGGIANKDKIGFEKEMDMIIKSL
ncbi:MAG: cytochrome c biogenesis protein ResB [Nitrospirota bacterium]